jgi:surface antigen/LysM repeat protein
MIIRTPISALNSVQARQLKNQVSGRERQVIKRTHHSLKSTTVAAYVGAFLFITAIVAIGYQPPQQAATDSVANAVTPQSLASNMTDVSAPSVDQLVATRVAAGIAERAELPIAHNIAEISISLSVESQLAQADNNVIVKPQIIQPAASSREMRSYTTVSGDSVDKLAAQFGVTADTIKWTNNLASDALEPGRVLQIPPQNGITYTVKDGDTTASIAARYKADERQIILYNDLEEGGLAAGMKIFILDGELPVTERPGYVAPRPVYSSYGGAVIGNYGGGSVGNRYAFGNCTYYAYDRRAALGRPIGSFWGNASTWAVAARSAGYLVDHNPEPGAVAQWNAYSDAWIGFYGHVAVVETVNGDGTITISEMNNGSLGGYNIVNRRTIPASSVSNYIH